MSVVSIACFFIDFLILLSCLPKKTDPFSPARVFGFVWALAIGLESLKFSRYQHEWSTYSWIVFLLGIVGFLLGTFVMYCYNLNRKLLAISEIRGLLQVQASQNFDAVRFSRIVVFLFFAYLICYCAEAAIIGNVPMFSPHIETARVGFGVFGINLVVDAMVAILFLIAEYFLLIRGQTVRKTFLALIFFLTAITFLLLLQRYSFVIWALMTLAFTYYVSRHLKFRNLLIAVGTFWGMLVYIRSIRLSQYVEQYHYVVSQMKYPVNYAVFTEPYMYIVMNLDNFSRAVDKIEKFYYGYFTTDWVLALTGLKHSLENYWNIDLFPSLVSGYNTYSFHLWYYYDFGVIGVAAFPFFLGLAISYLYYRIRKSPTIIVAILYSVGFLLMTVSFIVNPLNRLEFIFNVFLILFVNVLVFRKRLPGSVEVH